MKTNVSALNVELNLYCPRRSCPYYQLPDNKITKDGVYRTKNDPQPRQMFRCSGGHHRFSETGYSELFAKHGSFKEYEQTAKMSCYGMSTDEIADVLEKDARTIQTWQRGISKKVERFHNILCLTIALTVIAVQMDELWSYLCNKNKQLWVFIGLEAKTRFWFNFELGSRTINTATKLVRWIDKVLPTFSQENPLIITTDKLAAYRHALANILKDKAYAYLQIVKKRFKRKLKTVEKLFVKGTAANFPEKTQNTSFVERFNLTLRQHVCYLQRKTLGYCKKKASFSNVLWINLYSYNYLTPHKSLRISIESNHKQRFHLHWQQRTPAMAIGLTPQVLSWRFLFLVPMRLNC
jgi:IS1 family transposase